MLRNALVLNKWCHPCCSACALSHVFLPLPLREQTYLKATFSISILSQKPIWPHEGDCTNITFICIIRIVYANEVQYSSQNAKKKELYSSSVSHRWFTGIVEIDKCYSIRILTNVLMETFFLICYFS